MNWIILILISALFVAFKDVIIKEILDHNHTLPLTLMLSGSTTIAMLAFYQKIAFIIPGHVLGLLFVKSLILALAWVLIFKAMKNLKISIVAPLTTLSPAILVVLSYFFLGERISLLNLAGIVLLIFAGYSLELDSFYKFTHPLKFLKNKYFGYIMIALIFGSISAILDKKIIEYINPYTFLFYMFFLLSVIFFVYLSLTERLVGMKYLWNNSWKLILLLIPIVIIADLAYFLAVAIPTTLIALIIPLKRTSTLFTVIIGGNLFKEDHLWHKVLITLIMLVGIYLVII